MLTAIYSFCYVGAVVFPWEIFWLLSIIGYFVIFMFFPFNRSKKGRKNILLAFVSAEAFFDIVWAIIFAVNNFYLEYLVGVTYGLFMWIAILLCAGVVSTLINCKKIKNKS